MILYSILTPLEDLLRSILDALHSIGLPWAWAIVGLTVIVRILLVPLTVKQIHSMQNMQAHAPEMKEIQRKYKGDRQKLNEELMKFYKENNINPASSCLPLLAQFPIFIGLFYTLRAFAKNPPPGDLSWLHFVPSIAEKANSHWSGYVLLVVYVTSQLLSLLLSTTAVQSKGQRYVLLALPFVFIPFIINFPVGLMIYWVTTNLWTTGQGLVTRQLRPKPVQPEKRSSRTPSSKSDSGDGAKPEQSPKPAQAQSQPQAPRRVKRKKKRARR